MAIYLILALKLALPISLWAESDPPDPQVEALKQVEAQKKEVALWVLAIGVSQYEDSSLNLKYADHDAQRIAQALQTQQGVLFQEVLTKILVNQRVTRKEILKSMRDFLGQAAPKDVVLIFVAGHGLQSRQTGTYYFVPYDAKAGNLDFAGLPMPVFEEVIKLLRTQVDKLILWLDTSHVVPPEVAAQGVIMGEDLAEVLQDARGRGLDVLSASRGSEESLDDADYRLDGEDRGHGAFAYSLLRGLLGEKTDTNQVVWLSDLFSHVSKEVPRLTKGRQHPYSLFQGTDLPISVRSGIVLPQLNSLPPAGLTKSTSTPSKRK